MKNLSKKIISLIMALLILVSAIPTNIFANGINENSKGLILAEEPIVIEPKINPEYEYYLQHKDEYIYGYIPPKYVLPFQKSSDPSYQTRSLDIPEQYKKEYRTPAKFITPVKHQQQTGTCWAHAAISTIETLILKRGLADYKDLDLSEGHMVLNSLSDTNFETGGNNMIALQYLTNLSGPVNEKDFPGYTIVGEGIQNSKIGSMEDADKKLYEYYIPNTIILENTVDNIKRCVYNYGSVADGYWSDPGKKGMVTNYHYVNIDSDGNGKSNHQVTIIGWKDSMEIDGNKGAFLVKNSWGTNMGDNGYYWISYASFTEGKRDPIIVFTDVEGKIENLKNLYTYSNHEDKASFTGYKDTGKIAGINIFDRKEKNPEEISKVTFYNPNNYSFNYDLYITQEEDLIENNSEYGNFIDISKNTYKWEKVSSGSFDSEGFFTINLDKPYKLDKDKFALRIELSGATMISLEETNPKPGKTFIFDRNFNIFKERENGNLYLSAITREVSNPSIEITGPEKPWETKEGYDIETLEPLTLTVKNNGNVSLNNLIISLDRACRENFTLINQGNLPDKLKKDGEVNVQIKPKEQITLENDDKIFNVTLSVGAKELEKHVTKDFKFKVTVNKEARAELNAQKTADAALKILEDKNGDVTGQQITDAETLVNKVTDPDKKQKFEGRLQAVKDAKAKKERLEKEALEAATQLVEKAETEKTQEAYNEANKKVEDLKPSEGKTKLEARLLDVDKYIQADNAIKALDAKKGNVTDGEIQAAQGKVNEVTNETNKQALNNKLDKVREAKADKEAQDTADKAIKVLEDKKGNVTDKEIQEAQTKVDKVKDLTAKQSLTSRLDNVRQAKADLETAEKEAIEAAKELVKKAEELQTEDAYNEAKQKVEVLKPSGAKTELEARLVDVDKLIKADKALDTLEKKNISEVTAKELTDAEALVNNVVKNEWKQELTNRLNDLKTKKLADDKRKAEEAKKLADTKEAAINKINGLNKLSETEKTDHIGKVNSSNKVEDVNTALLDAQKNNAKNIVAGLNKLKENEVTKANEDINKATDENAINEIVKAEQKLQTERQSLDEYKDQVRKKLDNLNNLTAEEKGIYNKEIDEAATKEVADTIVLDAQKDNAQKEIDKMNLLKPDEATNAKDAIQNAADENAIKAIVDAAQAKQNARQELEDYKNQEKAKVDKLGKLNQDEKDAYKARISGAETKEDVDSIVLDAQKDNAKKIIASLDKLIDSERTNADQDIQNATNVAKINEIVKVAEDLQNSRLSLEEAKIKGKEIVNQDNMKFLTPEEITTFIARIESATTPDKVKEVVNEATALNRSRDLEKILSDKREEAIKELDELKNLESSQIQMLKTKIANATSLDEIAQIMEEARNLDRTNKLRDDFTNYSLWNYIPAINSYETKINPTPLAKVADKKEKSKKVETKPYVYRYVIGKTKFSENQDGTKNEKELDVAPFIENGRTMLPLRAIAESIGIKVSWVDSTRTAIFTNGDLVAEIQIDGNKVVLSDGRIITLDAKPKIVKGRIVLPITNVSLIFGLTNGNTSDGEDHNIEWDSETQSVIIRVNK